MTRLLAISLAALGFLKTLADCDQYIPTAAQMHNFTLAIVGLSVVVLAALVETSYRKVGGLRFFRLGSLWGSFGVSKG